MKKKMYVHVPTSVVRNEGIYIDNGTFLLYARLCLLYFKNYRNEEIVFLHKELMKRLHIEDIRTFKKRMENLYKSGLIENKIEKLPRSKPITVILNKKKLEEKLFTQLNVNIFDYVGKINEHAFRLVFYYKSHINYHVLDRDFCFVGYETLQEKLKMGSTTISEANEQLKKNKLIKIEKHQLESCNEYDEDDELLFSRWNNHYKLHDVIL